MQILGNQWPWKVHIVYNLDSILCFLKIHSFYRPKKRFENSYVSGPGTTPLLGVTIGQLLEKTAGRYGDDDAVVVVHQKIRKTYQQLLREVI